jgi:hypothetical protein
MDEELCRNVRESAVSLLSLYASAEDLRRYREEVPFADHRAELFCMWFDDLHHPGDDTWNAAFSEAERRALEEFTQVFKAAKSSLLYDYLELLESEAWRPVAAKAAEVVKLFEN